MSARDASAIGHGHHMTVQGVGFEPTAWIRLEIPGFGSRSIEWNQLAELLYDDDSWDAIKARLQALNGRRHEQPGV